MTVDGAGNHAKERRVIKGVPRVKFFDGGPRCPEDIPFPSVMRALMEYLGEESYGCRVCRPTPPGSRIRCSYAFFIGVTGVASFVNWKPGWEGDNVEIMYMSDDPAAPFDRAFQAAGYAYQFHGPEAGAELQRQQIMASIQRGRPVVAFGPIGPPEAALVTGYDEGGDVLVGWSFFQSIPGVNDGVEFEPSGEFRVRNWSSYPPGFSFITVGDKAASRPALSDTYRRALEWMLQVTRTPATFGDRRNGLAAYDAWADQLLRDEDFPKDDGVLFQRHDVHNNVAGLVAEARWYGAQFLGSMAEGGDDIVHRDAIEDLYHAAALYAGDHALMWRLWDLVGGIDNPTAWKGFADPTVRRRMVPTIRQARDNDARAAEHIERVLNRWR
jgi:hypothetical protein